MMNSITTNSLITKRLPLILVWTILWVVGPQYFSVAQNSGHTVSNYSYITKERTWPADESVDSAKIVIALSYPQFNSPDQFAVMDSINSYMSRRLYAPVFDSHPIDSMEDLEHQMIQEYLDLLEQYPDYKFRWELDRSITVILDHKKLISLQFSEFTYTGGAHPNSWEFYTTFHRDSGQELVLQDFVLEGKMKQLREVAEQRFREIKGIPETASMKSYGYWFTNDQFQLSENAAMGAQGLILYYNNYEIAPYAMGPTRLLLPYDQCTGILKTSYIP
jgi:hypothetical protein